MFKKGDVVICVAQGLDPLVLLEVGKEYTVAEDEYTNYTNSNMVSIEGKGAFYSSRFKLKEKKVEQYYLYGGALGGLSGPYNSEDVVMQVLENKTNGEYTVMKAVKRVEVSREVVVKEIV